VTVVCFRETSGRLLGEVRRTSSELSGVDTSLVSSDKQWVSFRRRLGLGAFCREQTLALVAASNPNRYGLVPVVARGGPRALASEASVLFFSSSAPFSTSYILWSTLMTDALEDEVNICTLNRASLPD